MTPASLICLLAMYFEQPVALATALFLAVRIGTQRGQQDALGVSLLRTEVTAPALPFSTTSLRYVTALVKSHAILNAKSARRRSSLRCYLPGTPTYRSASNSTCRSAHRAQCVVGVLMERHGVLDVCVLGI